MKNPTLKKRKKKEEKKSFECSPTPPTRNQITNKQQKEGRKNEKK